MAWYTYKVSFAFTFVTAIYYNFHICIHMFTLILDSTDYIVTSDTSGFAAMVHAPKPKPSVSPTVASGEMASGSVGPPPPPPVFPPPSIPHVPDMRRPAEPAEPPALGRKRPLALVKTLFEKTMIASGPPENIHGHHTIVLTWFTDGLCPAKMAECL